MYTSAFLLSLLPVVLAQYGGGDSGSASSSTSAAAPATSTAATPDGVQVVHVSNLKGDLTFTPDSFNASVGSKVEFLFYPQTHSVAQASFAEPCVPLANNTGFFSGGITTSSGANTEKTFTITVNDTKPIWFYCGFPGHCEAGMVGVINPPADGSKTIDQFKAAAAKVAKTVPPSATQGGVIAPQSEVSGTGSATSGSPSSTSSTKPNAGVESRGGVQWLLLGITGLVAAGFGSLIL